jgi:hypothetical protein
VKRFGLVALVLCSCGELGFSPAPCYDSAGHEVDCSRDAGSSDGQTADAGAEMSDAAADTVAPAQAVADGSTTF